MAVKEAEVSSEKPVDPKVVLEVKKEAGEVFSTVQAENPEAPEL